jgi:hypothetical protein
MSVDWSNYETGRENDPDYHDGYVDGYWAAQVAQDEDDD